MSLYFKLFKRQGRTRSQTNEKEFKQMTEIIKHLFGLCGEPHLNIFTITILLALPLLYTAIRKKTKINE